MCDPRDSGTSRDREGRRHDGMGPSDATATLLYATIISGRDTDRKEAVTVSHRLAHFAFLVLHCDDVFPGGKSLQNSNNTTVFS